MAGTAVLAGSALASPPILVGALLVALFAVVFGGVLLRLTWRVLTIALGVVVGVWALGVLGF